MEHKLRNVLIRLAERLNKSGILWGLGGSGMLHFYGLAAEPRDLDLMIAWEDADQAIEVLHPMGVLAELQPKPPFCSRRFLRLQTGEVETDLISVFRIRHSEGIYELPLEKHSVTRTIRLEETTIPLTSPEDWYVLYLLMERQERAAGLEQYFRGTGGIRNPELLERCLNRSLPGDIRSRVEALLDGEAINSPKKNEPI